MFARTHRITGGMIILTLLFAGYAQGAILTFTMEGKITTVNDPLGLLTFAGINDRVKYTFSFDSMTPDTISGPMIGSYQAMSAELHVGGTAFAQAPGGPPWIAVQHPLDSYAVSSDFSTGRPDLYETGFVNFVLIDQVENNALMSDALPLAPLDLATFHSNYFSVQFWPADGGYNPPTLSFSGAIDSFTPEPSCMVALALGALAFRRTRRSRLD